jgi:hypothetical protein
VKAGNQSFSQLFVARSHNICKHVQKAVGSDPDNLTEGQRLDFLTFGKLKDLCGDCLPGSEEESKYKDRSKRIDFSRFKRDFHTIIRESGLDALIVWTQIRSSIKGSIHAVVQRRALTLKEYVDPKVIGARRCRLTTEQREAAYKAYEGYQQILEVDGLWDDCGRIDELLGLMDDKCELRYSNIYVDEIQVRIFFCFFDSPSVGVVRAHVFSSTSRSRNFQDYTQAEIALFYKLCQGK